MRGFTLIELLATIVILAIILLTATFTISNLIDSFRKNSLESSTSMIIKAAELDSARRRTDGDLRKVEYTFIEGVQSVAPVGVSELSISGKLPKDGKITVYEDGRVEAKITDGTNYVATDGLGKIKDAVTYVPTKHDPLLEGTNSWIFEVKIYNNGNSFIFAALNPNLNIKWGDNTETNNNTVGATTISHVYQKGTYNVTLTGTSDQISFCNLNNVLSYSCVGIPQSVIDVLTPIPLSMGLKSANSMFADTVMVAASSLNFFDEASINITDMSWMFFRSRLNQSLSNWNTSNVTNMYSMFNDARYFNGSLENWNTSKVTNMARMFNGADIFNQPIGTWNTSSVTDMSWMFASDEVFNQPIGTWNTSSVTNMAKMFFGVLDFNQPIGTWDTSKVTDMSGMFDANIRFNQPIGTWNTSSLITTAGMFRQAQVFNQPLGTWNTSNLTTASGMFSFAYAFNQPLGSWNTSKLTNTSEMFRYASDFNQPIGTWNTASITNMGSMFMGASEFNQNLSSWCVTNIPTAPSSFDSFASAWALPRPVWGTCP